MKSIGYIRVSTEEQANSGLGIQSQRDRITAQAAALSLELVEVIEDAGKSGKNMDRPGLQRVIELTRSGVVHAVIILKLDRLTRSVRDLGFLLDLFTKYDVALVAVTDAINTATAAGRFMVNVLGSIAQWERETISERTSAALKVKRDRGERTGGTVPYGFDVVGQIRNVVDGTVRMVRGRLVPNEGEQAMIRRMRGLREIGWSFRRIANDLDTREVKPKKGKHWHPETVKRVIGE